MKLFILITSLLFSSFLSSAQESFNGNIERLDSKWNPIGWDLTFDGYNAFRVDVDSAVKYQGKYSISIASGNSTSTSGAISYRIPSRFKGKRITLVAAIKTENISGGFAGIWLRTDGGDKKVLDFNNMEKQGLKGTNDWKEYMIEIPNREESVDQVSLGALLVGKGKMWVDSFRLYIDYVPIDKAIIIKKNIALQSLDTAFSNGSTISKFPSSKQAIDKLAILAQYWVFLKYHHPEIASGRVNWDADLFRLLLNILSSNSEEGFSKVLERKVDSLKLPELCPSCDTISANKNIALKADYGELFSSNLISTSLKEKLKYILKNRNTGKNYYFGLISFSPANPTFDNEKAYQHIRFPDVGYQLLSIFRYYGAIKYLSPNRELISENLEVLLRRTILSGIVPLQKTDYVKLMAEFISSVEDGHSFIHNDILEEFKGRYRLPIKAVFLRANKLVVTGFYKQFPESKLQAGDLLLKINGQNISYLIKKFSPVTPASNKEAQRNKLLNDFILRSNIQKFNVDVLRHGKILMLTENAVESSSVNFYDQDLSIDGPSYKILPGNIAYIHAKKFNKNWQDIRTELDKTSGIIIDLRTYPDFRNTYELINYIKSSLTDFVLYSYLHPGFPGQFVYSAPLQNGLVGNRPYQGKVVVLVNSTTISQAEFTAMSFQSFKNTTVVGSRSAGADGTVSDIVLPGDIRTGFSGIGVYYPNGMNTQKNGVKIDKHVIPTIKGIRLKKDEVLEQAIKLIIRGNH